jgi:crotonobetainyl-CoA:carnitine CoA-transferase CaiB-like acyl-CoA transferase
MPLTGMRVLDLTRIIAGPFCTLMLGDMGAEVIKIEPPKDGDPLRAQGVIKDGLSWYYASYNRNKKSLSVDLRSAEGKDILSELIKTSDVVVENFRPGVMDKMGFGYDRLKELKPGIIYCGITGFGKSGPYKDRPAFDFIAQAMSGFMSVNGNDGEEPLRAGIPISDLVAGLYAAFGIMSALVHRARTGEGQEVQSSLVDGLVSMLSYMAANYLAAGKLPVRTGNDHPLVAPYGIFRCSDGEVAIAPSNDQVYFKFLSALGLDHLRDVPEFATNDLRMVNRKLIKAAIQEVIAQKPKSHWIDYLNKAGVPCGTAMNLSEVFADAQVKHQEMVLDVPHPGHGTVRMVGFPVKLSGTPCRVERPAPELGQHTDEILQSLGMKLEKIAELHNRGII